MNAGGAIKAINLVSATFAIHFKMSADVKQSAATDPTKATDPALLLHLFCCRFLFSQLIVSLKHSLLCLIQCYEALAPLSHTILCRSLRHKLTFPPAQWSRRRTACASLLSPSPTAPFVPCIPEFATPSSLSPLCLFPPFFSNPSSSIPRRLPPACRFLCTVSTLNSFNQPLSPQKPSLVRSAVALTFEMALNQLLPIVTFYGRES